MPAARVSPATDFHEGRNEKSRSSKDTSSSDGSPTELRNKSEKENQVEEFTPYQEVMRKLQTHQKWHQDISEGKRIGFYRLKEELGTGNFSQVKAAVHTLTKEKVAVKILDKSKLDQKTQNMLDREILSMESLHHPNVIRLFEVLETLSKIYLVMEYANGGELFLRISQQGSFSERAAKPLFAQITAAVDHMHFHNIIHRDLKAENVFFSDPNTVKVGDFGFSTLVRDTQEPLRTFCGSPPYAAPELFRDDSYVGPTVDIWAMGVLLYFMLTATMPFRATTVAALKKQILEGEYQIPDVLTTDCHYLIRSILRQDPKTRVTLEQVKKSNWLAGQTLPVALPDVKLLSCMSDLNGNDKHVSSVEQDVKDRLSNYGITDGMLEEAHRKGSRSNVMGTYRIILHGTLTEMRVCETNVIKHNTPQKLKPKNSPKKGKTKKNKKSKTCTIL